MRRQVDWLAPGRNGKTPNPAIWIPGLSLAPSQEWLKKRSTGTRGTGYKAKPPDRSMRTRPPSLDALGAGGGSPEADVRYAGVSAP